MYYSCTALMGGRKAIFLKNHYFHVLTSPLGQKSHAYSENDLKKFAFASRSLFAKVHSNKNPEVEKLDGKE